MLVEILSVVTKYLFVSVFVYESYRIGKGIVADGFKERIWIHIQALFVIVFLAFVLLLKSSFSEFTGERTQEATISQFIETLIILYVPFLIGFYKIS
jgi:hypothetical protein